MSLLKSHFLLLLPMLWWIHADTRPMSAPHTASEWPLDNKLVQLFPNPASTVVYFTYQGPSNQQHILQIYSFIGKKMTEARIYGNTRLMIQLDENYYRGIYIYQLRDLDGRMIESGKFQVVK